MNNMKKINKFRLLTLLVLTLAVFSLVCIPSYASEVAVIDDAGILTDSEYSALTAELIEKGNEAKCRFRVYIYRSYDEDESLEIEASVVKRFGLTMDSSLTMLIIRVAGNEYFYDLFKYGSADNRITGLEVDRILDTPEVYDNIKGGEIVTGVTAFAEVSATAINGKLRAPVYIGILVSAAIALVIALAVVFYIYFSYKKKLKSPSYPLERYASLNLNASNDAFVDKIVTRTPRSSGSGSRSRGGGRSGHCGGR